MIGSFMDGVELVLCTAFTIIMFAGGNIGPGLMALTATLLILVFPHRRARQRTTVTTTVEQVRRTRQPTPEERAIREEWEVE